MGYSYLGYIHDHIIDASGGSKGFHNEGLLNQYWHARCISNSSISSHKTIKASNIQFQFSLPETTKSVADMKSSKIYFAKATLTYRM
jgi:hypothetical protein